MDLIAKLKEIKRDSVTKNGQDIQVLFTDVKEAPAHLQLIRDENPVTDQIPPTMP